MTLKTELPTNSLLPLTAIQQQTQYILPTRIYRQVKYTANNNKLLTTVFVSEENFSLAEKIKSVPAHFEDKMYQHILSQNQCPTSLCPCLPLPASALAVVVAINKDYCHRSPSTLRPWQWWSLLMAVVMDGGGGGMEGR